MAHGNMQIWNKLHRKFKKKQWPAVHTRKSIVIIMVLVRCVMRLRVLSGVANTYDFKWVVNLHWWQKNLIQRQWTEELILIVFSYICIESRNSWARSIMWTFFTCSINVALLTYMSWHKGHLRAIIVSNLFSKFYQGVIQYLQTSDQNFTTIFKFQPLVPADHFFLKRVLADDKQQVKVDE